MTINLKIIIPIAILAILIAWLIVYLDKSSTSSKDKLLYPKLSDDVNNLTKMSISTNGENVTLKKQDNDWIIEEKFNFLADKNKIRQLVTNLSSSILKERKTKNPDNYSKLGLDDNQSTKVSIYKNSDKPLIDLRIGDIMHQLEGSYVKKESEKQSWLISNKIEVEADPKNWLKSNLFSIKNDRIKNVSITHSKNKKSQDNVKISKNDEGKFDLIGISKKKTSDEYSINNIIAKLSNFEIEDIEDAKNVKFRKSKIITTSFQTNDGLEGVICLTKTKDKNYAKIEFIFDEKLIEKENDNMSSAFEVETKNEVDDLNKKLSGYVFEISDYNYKILIKKRSELTK